MQGHLEQLELLDSRQFLLAIKRLATSLSYGTDRSSLLGAGVEFVQSRPYAWGDPIKAIDWRVTARTGKVHVKQFEAPKRIPCFLLVDTSASMTVSSTSRSKYALAVHLAGGIALACLERVSPVGVLGVGQREFRIEPTLSKDQVLPWLYRLRSFRYDEATLLSRRIAQLSPSLKHRALVVVLSDLHDPNAPDALRQLAQQHDVVVLQLQDPAEIQVRGAGLLRAREAETGRAFVTRGGRAWHQHHDVAHHLKRSGIDQLAIATDKTFVHQLRHFFQARNLLGRRA